MKRSLFFQFLLSAVILTVLILLIYASVQQSYRTAVNDPQVQIAGDMVTSLQNGQSAEDVVGHDTVNLASSLSTFRAVYGSDHKPMRS